jgi:hypothetical protein
VEGEGDGGLEVGLGDGGSDNKAGRWERRLRVRIMMIWVTVHKCMEESS